MEGDGALSWTKEGGRSSVRPASLVQGSSTEAVVSYLGEGSNMERTGSTQLNINLEVPVVRILLILCSFLLLIFPKIHHLHGQAQYAQIEA